MSEGTKLKTTIYTGFGIREPREGANGLRVRVTTAAVLVVSPECRHGSMAVRQRETRRAEGGGRVALWQTSGPAVWWKGLGTRGSGRQGPLTGWKMGHASEGSFELGDSWGLSNGCCLAVVGKES
ncbi:hypothetical protein GUJ93_ZPchr0013g34417 [Zizania palustris]|uniref:Uncharacterized protein n=1 Tax=Zizania palustris TaxID=103762 RepID=A0A8J5X1U5_ZIZPA|nr:hypothetical protein GUJ93_ZPchr0013g34417 [Zizania palustris]